MNETRILVVDDEEDLCEILKFNLENEGYEVDTANSAEEALKMDISSYHLILLDVMMGEISGFKMANILKKDKKTAKVPIIFITAKDTENDTVTGFNLGADDYISKPFSLREVIARVKAVLRQLAVRMSHIQEIISYKKATGIPILQPEQEKKQTDALAAKLGDNEFEEEILDIFKYIMKNSRRIQAKSLFDYNIFLIGFMGAGKSTVAGELKDKLEMDRVEMDQMIVENRGMSISEIFDEFGEAYFRNLESNTLIELQKRKQTIVSCGGGVVMREENADHMKKNGRVVLLTAKPETIYERVKDSDERPILNGNMNVEYISGLMEKRKERYEAVADVTVATDGKNVTQICEEIIAKLIALDNEQDKKQA